MGYWTKIIVRALVVFAVGLTIWLLARDTKERVVSVVEGASALTIPLPFDIVPFRVDGERLGSVKRLVIHRSGRHSVESVVIYASLADSVSGEALEGCALSLESLDDLDEDSTFECTRGEIPEGMLAFGVVEVPGRGPISLLLPAQEVLDMRDEDRDHEEEDRVRMVRRQVRVAQERSVIAAAQAESLEAVMDRFDEAWGDSIAAVVAERLEELAAHMRESAKAAGDAAKETPATPETPAEPSKP